MKRNNLFGVWQRCRVCGSVFPERAELQEHMASHPIKQKQSERAEMLHEFATELDTEPQKYTPRAVGASR